jgi:hypothetical protein
VGKVSAVSAFGHAIFARYAWMHHAPGAAWWLASFAALSIAQAVIMNLVAKEQGE